MADTIFRFTGASDNLGGLVTTEKIIFNTGTVPDSTGRLVSPSFRMVSDLNPHPNPDTKLNPIQDSLLGVVEVTVAGYFVNHNITVGPRNLYNWSIDEDVNTNFQFGRFGLALTTMNGILNVTPTTGLNGTGYMLSEIDIIDQEDPRTKVGFIARFLRNGAITTISGLSVVKITFSAGSGYSSPPSVAVAAPSSGVTATAVAEISGGSISRITVTNAGNGYTTSPPSVTISGNGTGTAVVG